MPGFSDHRLQKGILDAGQFSMVSPPEALTSRHAGSEEPETQQCSDLARKLRSKVLWCRYCLVLEVGFVSPGIPLILNLLDQDCGV